FGRSRARSARSGCRLSVARLRTAAARRSGRQSSAFGENFHVLEGLRELRSPPRLIAFAGRIIRQHGVIEHEGINELRRGRRQRPRFESSVIQIVWLAGPHWLRISVGKFGFSYEDLVGNGTHGANFTVLARSDRARDS